MFQNKIWLTYDVEVKNGIVLDFTAECEQLLSLLISLVKILNGDFSRQWCLYLFEHKWFSPLLGGSCLPHTDGSASATGDNQLRVWAYGTNDLTPFWQTFVYHQCLKVRMRPEVIKVADKEKDHSVTGIKFLLQLMLCNWEILWKHKKNKALKALCRSTFWSMAVINLILLSLIELLSFRCSSIYTGERKQQSKTSAGCLQEST